MLVPGVLNPTLDEAMLLAGRCPPVDCHGNRFSQLLRRLAPVHSRTSAGVAPMVT